MKVLAFDTALGACSAAIVEDRRVLARAFEPRRQGHAEALMPMVERVRAEACLKYADIDRLAVTVGPGTFTGLRVGLSVARGLALAMSKPLVGLTTLEVLAAAALTENEQHKDHLSVLIDARRGQVYTQSFAPDRRPLNSAAAIDIADIAAHLPPGPGGLVGSGVVIAKEMLAEQRPDLLALAGPDQPDAVIVAALGASRELTDDSTPPRPLYLRPPDAKLPTP
jgi:tRNA threonylcarbamoyladenosine biosynthesis protein TsaB